MDIHSFDGKIVHSVQKYPVDVVREKINLYVDRINHPNFVVLKNSIGHVANYDPSNDYAVEDILYELFCRCDKMTSSQLDDVLLMMNIQLEEMNTGMCAQGRTHRMYQVLLFSESIVNHMTADT